MSKKNAKLGTSELQGIRNLHPWALMTDEYGQVVGPGDEENMNGRIVA